jgi:hypothetical protein
MIYHASLLLNHGWRGYEGEGPNSQQAGIDLLAPTTRNPLPVTRYPLPVTRYPLPVTRYPLPVTRYPLPVTRYPLPVTRYPLPATSPAPTPNPITYPTTLAKNRLKCFSKK